jgi:hypothetical protein
MAVPTHTRVAAEVRADYPGFYSMWRRVSALFPSLARAGIARVTLGTGFGACLQEPVGTLAPSPPPRASYEAIGPSS